MPLRGDPPPPQRDYRAAPTGGIIAPPGPITALDAQTPGIVGATANR